MCDQLAAGCTEDYEQIRDGSIVPSCNAGPDEGLRGRGWLGRLAGAGRGVGHVKHSDALAVADEIGQG